MMLTFEDFTNFYPNQTWLRLSDTDLAAAQQHCDQTPYSNNNSRDRAQQNFLALQILSGWFQEVLELDSRPSAWLSSEELPGVWDVVNGTILSVNGIKVALLPSDAVDLEELAVPQEFVDLPDWTAAYYLAVQFDWEQQWLRILGYASHQQLKHQAEFDPIDRTYYLDQADLAEDLSLLWTACDVLTIPEPAVAPIPSMTPQTAAQLLQSLQAVTRYSPRLDYDFADWAALIANPQWRHQLYAARSQSSTAAAAVPASSPADRVRPAVVQLRQWLNGVIEPGWYAVRDAIQGQSLNLESAIARSAEGYNVEPQAQNIQLGEFEVVLVLGIRPMLADVALNPETNRSNADMQVSVQARLADHSPVPRSPIEICISDQDDDPVTQDAANAPGEPVSVPPFIVTAGEEFGVRILLGEISSNLCRFKA